MQKKFLCWIAALIVIALVANIQMATAQIVPFKTFGSDSVYSPLTGDYSGMGRGTHMGRHEFFGNVMTVQTGALTADWFSTAPQETIAADGSKIFFNASGTVELIPLDNQGNFTACWEGEFEVVVGAGTGRFSNAGPGPEPLRVQAINDPFNIFTDLEWTFSWTLNGKIDLGKK